MSGVNGLFSFNDRLTIETLNQRVNRAQVINSNIANSETPGFRAIGYDFEEQLQVLGDMNEPIAVKTSNPRHWRHEFTSSDGTVVPDIYVQPTESVGEDGNTVDVDKEMTSLAKNEILFRAAAETISRKIGMLKYAINGGR